MTKELELNVYGLELVVEVEYEVEDNKCGITEVHYVAARMKNGLPVALKCDMTRFMEDLEGELQEALENAIQADYEAYCDALYEQAKEEGKL